MDNQLSLGEFFVFTVTAAEYDKLKRSTSYRWQKHDPLGLPPTYQFQGVGETTIILSGTHHVYDASDLDVPGQMETAAASGKPMELLAGFDANQATYEGKWIITTIEFENSDILANGIGQTVTFSITLKAYGEGEQ